MNNSSKKLFALIITTGLIGITGCSSTHTSEQNATAGAVTGGVIGGLAGSLIGAGTGQLVAVGIGAVTGALIGGSVGQSMESSDKMRSYRVMDNNPTNATTHWVNPKTKQHFTIAPTSGTFTYNGYSTCRRYYSTGYTGNEKFKISGIACRLPDGSWQSQTTTQ